MPLTFDSTPGSTSPCGPTFAILSTMRCAIFLFRTLKQQKGGNVMVVGKPRAVESYCAGITVGKALANSRFLPKSSSSSSSCEAYSSSYSYASFLSPYSPYFSSFSSSSFCLLRSCCSLLFFCYFVILLLLLLLLLPILLYVFIIVFMFNVLLRCFLLLA